MAIMQRITIAGNAGAGKSTFAEELGLVTGLPVLHLDLIQFQPGWHKTPAAEFTRQHDSWLQQPSWIIEGVGDWQPLKKRFATADTIIYLDFPVELCLQRAQLRQEEDEITPNPFLPKNSPYAAKADKMETVIRFFHKEWRPKILNLMDSLREGKNLFVFTKPETLQEFLTTLKRPPV